MIIYYHYSTKEDMPYDDAYFNRGEIELDYAIYNLKSNTCKVELRYRCTHDLKIQMPGSEQFGIDISGYEWCIGRNISKRFPENGGNSIDLKKGTDWKTIMSIDNIDIGFFNVWIKMKTSTLYYNSDYGFTSAVHFDGVDDGYEHEGFYMYEDYTPQENYTDPTIGPPTIIDNGDNTFTVNIGKYTEGVNNNIHNVECFFTMGEDLTTYSYGTYPTPCDDTYVDKEVFIEASNYIICDSGAYISESAEGVVMYHALPLPYTIINAMYEGSYKSGVLYALHEREYKPVKQLYENQNNNFIELITRGGN